MTTFVFLNIDYDEMVPGSYRAVVVSVDGNCKGGEYRFETGSVTQDWQSGYEFVREFRIHHYVVTGKYPIVMEQSSCTHFVQDNAYHYDESNNIVRDED